jgi:hypothetical protein
MTADEEMEKSATQHKYVSGAMLILDFSDGLKLIDIKDAVI